MRWRLARSRPLVARFISLSVATLLILVSQALAAELQLRESVLQVQRDRVTMTITAVVDHLGERAHPLSEDCDLHVPLRSREIRVPFIGELKNACSEKPAGTSQAFWSDRIYEETHGLAVSVSGAFRIWLEHPPTGTAVQTEGARVPWYGNSNPDHQVELHPLVRVGSLDFSSHIKRIRDGGNSFAGYGPAQLSAILNKKLTIQRITIQGEPYVRIKGTKTGNNHWDLRARIASAPESLADGTRVRLDILNGNQVVSGALGLVAVSVAGTVADTRLQAVASGDIVRFQALIRMQLATLLDQLGPSEQQISLPVEFVLLDVETSP